MVVNAPDWFGSVFKFVKQFMAPGTQSKMEVLHKDQVSCGYYLVATLDLRVC